MHTSIGVFDPKSTDYGIKDSDEKDKAKDDVVQDVGAALALRVVDVHPTDDEEQEAHYHLGICRSWKTKIHFKPS